MNDTDREQRDRILKMLADGTLRPDEAAKLLAALSPAEDAAAKKQEAARKAAAKEKEDDKEKGKEKEKEKGKPQMMEVQMQRPDGSNYTVEVPPSLVPMIMKMAGVAIRESARTASIEAWDGFKTMVRNKTDEVKTTVKERVARPAGKTAPAPEAAPVEDPQFEARRRILQMVQNGRITAADASRLIQELDALNDYQKAAGSDSKS
jgi:hypothetical protein